MTEDTADDRATDDVAADAAAEPIAMEAPDASFHALDGGLVPEAQVKQDAALAANRARLARVEKRFTQQQRDDAWAGPYRDQLLDRFHGAKLDDVAEILDVDCRRTVCAIDLRFRSTEHLEDAVAKVTTAWLMTLKPCTYHMPGPLLLAGGADARLYVECQRD